MPSFEADPTNFAELLEIVRDGSEISLQPGDYKGPFTINRAIAIRGSGGETVLFAVDEPAVAVKVPGVRLENLTIARTVGGETGEVALLAESGTLPTLQQVRLTGKAENVRWSGASWDIPAVLDFGEIPPNRQIERDWELQLGSSCQVFWDADWLQVRSRHLSPGLQKLQLVINSQGIPGGTRLSSSLYLQAEDGKREISITAEIVSHSELVTTGLFSTQSAETPESFANAQGKIEKWGYRFVTKTAIARIIQEMAGETNDRSSAWEEDFHSRRDRAEQLLAELLQEQPHWFYLRRLGSGEELGEENFSLTLVSDLEQPAIPFLEERQKTLFLKAAVRDGGTDGLRFWAANFVPLARGRGDGFSTAVYLQLQRASQYRLGVRRSALKHIFQMPVSTDYIPTEEQLQIWQSFVQIERRIAESRQFCVPFWSHNYGADSRRVSFELNIDETTIDGSSETFLEPEEFWNRAFKARREEIRLFNSSPLGKSRRDGRILGRIDSVDAERRLMRIKLDADLLESINADYYQLPAAGYLLFEAFGEVSQINRKQTALDRLKRGYGQNPYLGKFFFDAGQARVPKQVEKLQPQDLLLPTANPEQVAAVEAVLAAPDLVLIQGPPGTGKTTVIAEICYQVARRGDRTLIASQANLAVDNALSRLVHSPIVRALRKGKAEKVQEEGAPYLEENAIGTWLQNTASHCETDLQKRRKNWEFYRQIRPIGEKFAAYLSEEETYVGDRRSWQRRQNDLVQTRTLWEQQYQAAQAQLRQVKQVRSELKSLLDAAPKVEWESPQVVDLLARLKPYSLKDDTVKNFISNVQIALKLISELGWVRPTDRGAFGLADWCCQIVAPRIEQLPTILIAVNQTAEAIGAGAAAVQQHQKLMGSLQQLNPEYQQALAQQKTLQQGYQNLQARQQEIERAVQEMGEWLKNASEQVYRLLKHSWQTGQSFNSNLIQLPPSTLRIAQTQKIAIALQYPNSPVTDSPDWQRLLKALDYETAGNFTNRKGHRAYFSQFLSESLNPPPIFLTRGDRTLWLELAAGYSNYAQLTASQRRDLVSQTRALLQHNQQQYVRIWQPEYVEKNLRRIAQEIVDEITDRARQCLLPVRTESERNLNYWKQRLDKIKTWIDTQQQQRMEVEYSVDLARQNAKEKVNQAAQQLQQLSQRQDLPTQLSTLVNQYQSNRAMIWEKASEFTAEVRDWENKITNLKTAIASLAHFQVLSHIYTLIEAYINERSENLPSLAQQLADGEIELQEINQKLATKMPETLLQKRNWWQQTWETLRDRLPKVTDDQCFDLSFLRQVKTQFQNWQQAGNRQETYLNRYQTLVEDWIEKLRHPSEQDQTELRRIYLDNANVIGITCVQSASRDFSEEFNKFDVVIIDEVSKCTPPELLIPALKAKCLVLVGDRCQLPPMLNDDTIEEIAVEMGSSKDALQFLEESFFKLQFDAAPAPIKTMLTVQYRMHPTIMGAINQFYDRRLQCGILDPDNARNHQLGSAIIQDHQHLVWVKMPQNPTFAERKEGTSFINPKEIDAIEQLCVEMDATWSNKISQGYAAKEIGIITFYRAQLNRIEERIIDSDRFPSLHIRTGTVDQFQGMERAVIIVSMVRNNPEKKVGFANKPERVNVAFSRARELLIIVGCHELFTQHFGQVGKIYSEVSNVVRHQGGLIDVSRILGETN